jgi:nucleoside-diphosphate-sugar epimerase
MDLPGAIERFSDTGQEVDELISGSVARLEDVARAFAVANPEIVILLAAHSSEGRGLVPSAEADPFTATATNVLGLLNTLTIAGERRTPRVVWASSTTVYAEAGRYAGPVDEESLVGPQSVYAASKVYGEQLIRTFRTSFDVEGVAVRPTLIWGPGIQYRGVQAALGDMVIAACTSEPTTVPAGSELWDLIYVKDAARALCDAATAASVPSVVTVSGYSASLDQVRQAVLDVAPDAPISIAGDAPHLGFPLVSDSSEASIGFTPKHDLPASIADFMATEQGVSRQNNRKEER